MAFAMSNAMGGQAALYRCDPTVSAIGRSTQYYQNLDRSFLFIIIFVFVVFIYFISSISLMKM